MAKTKAKSSNSLWFILLITLGIRKTDARKISTDCFATSNFLHCVKYMYSFYSQLNQGIHNSTTDMTRTVGFLVLDLQSPFWMNMHGLWELKWMALTYVFTVDGIAIKSNLLGMYKIIPVFFIEHSQNCVYGCAQDQPNDIFMYLRPICVHKFA